MAVSSLLYTSERSAVKTDPAYHYRATATTPFSVFFAFWFRNSYGDFKRVVGAEGSAIVYLSAGSGGDVFNVGYKAVAGAGSNIDLSVATYPGGGAIIPRGQWNYGYFEYSGSGNTVKAGVGTEAANNFANDVSHAFDAGGVKFDAGSGAAYPFGVGDNASNSVNVAAFASVFYFNDVLTDAERTYLMVAARTKEEVEAHITLGAKVVNDWDFSDAANMLAAGADSDGDFALFTAGADADDTLQGNGPASLLQPQYVTDIPLRSRFASGELAFTYAFDRVAPDYPSYYMFGGKPLNMPLELDPSVGGFQPWAVGQETTPPGVHSSANDASALELSNGRWQFFSSCYDLPTFTQFYAPGWRGFISSPGDRLTYTQNLFVGIDDAVNLLDGVTPYETLRDYFDAAGTTGPAGSTTPTPWSDTAGFIGAPDISPDPDVPDTGVLIFYGFPDDLASNGVLFIANYAVDPDTGVAAISDMQVVRGAEVDGFSWQDPCLQRVSAAHNALTPGVIGYRIGAKKYTQGVSASGGHTVGNSVLGNDTSFFDDYDDIVETDNAAEGLSLYYDAVRDALIFRTHLILSVPQEQTSGTRKDAFESGFAAGLGTPVRVGFWDGYGHNTPFISTQDDTSGSTDPAIVSVTISPASATIRRGAVQQLIAAVSRLNGAPTDVYWSLVGATQGGYITQDGKAHAFGEQDIGSETSFTVRATSQYDPTKYDDCVITVSGMEQVTAVTNITDSRWKRRILVPILNGQNASPVIQLNGGYVVGIEREAGLEGNEIVLLSSDAFGGTYAVVQDADDADIIATLTSGAGSQTFGRSIFGLLDYVKVKTRNSGANQNQTGNAMLILTVEFPDPKDRTND